MSRLHRFSGLFVGMVVVSCSNDGDTTDECESECPGTMRIVADAGISVDADSITVQICHLQDCGQVEMEVPATAETVSSEGEPLVSVTVTRTDDPFYEDLQGVFIFDATWTSPSASIEEGDLVGMSVTTADGSNVFSTGLTLKEGDLDPCGCPQVDLHR